MASQLSEHRLPGTVPVRTRIQVAKQSLGRDSIVPVRGDGTTPLDSIPKDNRSSAAFPCIPSGAVDVARRRVSGHCHELSRDGSLTGHRGRSNAADSEALEDNSTIDTT